MTLATDTLLDEPTTPRRTGIPLRVAGPGPGFVVVIERSPDGTSSWVERVRQYFPSGSGGVWIDAMPLTNTPYWYRCYAVAPGYQNSATLGPVQGYAIDCTDLRLIDSPPLNEAQSRLYGVLAGPTRINAVAKQDDGANVRSLVKGRQTFQARHKDVLTFAPTFQNIPKVRILGGATYVPGTIWTTADDYRTLKGSITSGATTLTATEGTFKAGDAGKAIKVTGAGVAGAVLTTTIASYTNSTTVTLTAAASTTVTGSKVEVYTGTLLAPLAAEQLDDSTLLGLTASGGTVQARLRQKNTTTTARTASFTAGAITTVGSGAALEADLGSNMPAYDDKYTVTFAVQLDTLVNTKLAPNYCETTLVVEVQSNDGSGWVTRGTYVYAGAASGLGDHQTDTWSESYQYTVAGLGTNDDWRVYVSSFTVDGNDGGSSFSVDPGRVDWSQGTNTDQYANRTPGPDDTVTVEVEAA